MRAAIYNPYWDTLGGGERYSLAFAEALVDSGYSVDIEWKNEGLLKRLEDRFGRKLRDIKVVNDIRRGDKYDICFWLSDGSIPLLRAKKNFIHFQFPFTDVNGSSLFNRMKFFRIDKFICNSNFTKKVIDKEYGVESITIYPPIDTESIKTKRKENIILYVGRFSRLTQSKGHELLINIFKKFYGSGFNGWKLVLAGGVEIGSSSYLKKLKKKGNGYPIEFIESPSYEKLVDIFGKAKYFWSAAGYNVDEENDPKKVEHFGISLVEAMSAGCIPIVYNSGGFKEIIKNGENGYLWNNKSEILKITKKLIKNSSEWKRLSDEAKITSKDFSYETFNKKVSQIIK